MCFARPLVLAVRWGMRRVVIGGAASLLQLPGFASRASVPAEPAEGVVAARPLIALVTGGSPGY
jgi:hypothetical protein